MTDQWGQKLDSVDVERKLSELQPDLKFDVAMKLGDWTYVLDTSPDKRRKMEAERVAIQYRDRYICAMDRGVIPEMKQWSVAERVVPVGMDEIDNDEVSIHWAVVPQETENYVDLWRLAQSGADPSLEIRADGKLVQYQCRAVRKVPSRVVRMGWRHTFERLLQAKIPGVTRKALAEKFGVDMNKYPTGPPDQVLAALTEE